MFEKEQLKLWAGSGAYGRGEDYYRRGLVGDLAIGLSSIEATVLGTYPYQVQLRMRGDILQSDCDCPVGLRSEFCKHCVAVALAWQDSGTSTATVSEPEGLKHWLKEKEPDELIALVLEISRNNSSVEKDLLLKIAARSADLKSLKQMIRKAIGSSFIDYYEMPTYGRGLARIGSMLEELLANRHAEEAQQLSLYAIERIAKALENMDDSDGIAGSEMYYWQELHLQAWQMKPPPDAQSRVALARELFELELNASWDEFYSACQSYADVIGKEGIAEYRRLIEAQWELLPLLKPGTGRDSFDCKRWKITNMKEAIAKASGDIDELIRIKSLDLSDAFNYLKIAELCRDAGRHDDAVEWVERGIAAFPEDWNASLKEFLISDCVRRGQHDRAVTLAWEIFEQSPSEAAWECLKTHAIHIGKWDEWKSWALDHVRDSIIREKRKYASSRYQSADHSLLVKLHLMEHDPESAWQEARSGGCHAQLWKKLGNALSDIDPKRAIVCIQHLVAPTIERTNNSAYEEAVSMMELIGIWSKAAGDCDSYRQWIAEISLRYKAKRNLIKLMRLHQLLP